MKFMRVLPALFLSLSAFASDPIRVVSDLDDTIKITNVDETGDAVWNGLFTRRAFAGMAELYRVMRESNPNLKFHYLSASNEALRQKVREFMSVNGFPSGQLILKGLLNFGDTGAYKRAKIEELLKKYPNDRFLLIGDDTQHDPGAYDAISKKYPERILGVYIRRVKGAALPPPARPFTTAFDVARAEYEFSRLESDLVGRVAGSILNENRDSRVLPAFHACPETAPLSLGSSSSVDEWDRLIDARIEKICSERD